jgi:hypothetical protein
MKIIETIKSPDDCSYPYFTIIERTYQDGAVDYMYEEYSRDGVVSKSVNPFGSYDAVLSYVKTLIKPKPNITNAKIISYVMSD